MTPVICSTASRKGCSLQNPYQMTGYTSESPDFMLSVIKHLGWILNLHMWSTYLPACFSPLLFSLPAKQLLRVGGTVLQVRAAVEECICWSCSHLLCGPKHLPLMQQRSLTIQPCFLPCARTQQGRSHSSAVAYMSSYRKAQAQPLGISSLGECA